MVQPRFRKYVSTDGKPKVPKARPRQVTDFWRVLSALPILAFLVLVTAIIAFVTPVKNSLSADYSPPASRADIGRYTRARWLLQDAQATQLGVDLAWYHRSKLSPAQSVMELDNTGFRPFFFVDEADRPLEILSTTQDPDGNVKPFLFAILPFQGTSGTYLSRRSAMYTNIIGRSWTRANEEIRTVNPQADTSVHGQFLPDAPQFAEEYVCYLADVWESAVASYAALYQRPPSSLDELLDGLGLEPNPACLWPIEPQLGVSFEGGFIDAKIAYWQVTLAGGATRGQARYYDAYTSYDDPDTPANIITRQGPSEVVDPGLIQGTRRVMFNLEILRHRLGVDG